jgi:hypothetical protein
VLTTLLDFICFFIGGAEPVAMGIFFPANAAIKVSLELLEL